MSDGIMFEETSIPEGLGEMPESNDPTCEVCGTPLYYGGRGRKPKFCDEHKRSAPKSSSGGSKGRNGAVVDAAMANLNMLNNMAKLPIGLISAPAGQVWNSKLDDLQAQSRAILESDPALAKSIAGAGAISGKWLLLGAYALAFKDVAAVAIIDNSQKRAAKAAAKKTQQQGLHSV